MRAKRVRIWASLVCAEAKRMLMHPAYVIACGAVAAGWAITVLRRGGLGEFPLLTNASWDAAVTLLQVACGAFFAAMLTGVRSYRFSTLELERVAPLSRGAQVGAQLVATFALGVVVAAMVTVYFGVLSNVETAIGEVLPADAATAPVVTIFAAVLGIVAGQIGRSVVVGAAVFVVVAVVSLAGLISEGSWRWLAPVVSENPFVIPSVPAAVVMRPSGWHLAWLLSVSGVLAALVLAFTVKRKRVLLVAVAAAAVAAVSVGAQISRPAMTESPRWRAAFTTPSPHQSCATREFTTYCTFQGFEPLVAA